MIMKASYDNCRNELGIARDSIQVQDSIISKQDLTIQNYSDQVEIYKKNESNYDQIILNKDSIIIEKKEQVKYYKKKTTAAYIITILNAVAFLLVII